MISTKIHHNFAAMHLLLRMITILSIQLIYHKVYLSRNYMWFSTGPLVTLMKAAVQLLPIIMDARRIVIVMTKTWILVTNAAIQVLKEILIIPMAAQVHCTTTLLQLFDNFLSHIHIIFLFSLFLFLSLLF